MTGDPKPIRYFWITAAAGWVLLAIAAAVYSNIKSVPLTLALPLALAFLVEYPFYLLPGFRAARAKFLERGRPAAAARLAASAVFPWLIYAVGTGHFNVPALLVMASIGVLMSFWFVVFPAHPIADLAYLAIFAALMLLKVFKPIFPEPMPKLDITILGKVMLIRVLAFSFMEFRGGIEAEYRFMPTAREWLEGLKWFAFLLPFVGAVYWALDLVKFREHPLNIGLVLGTLIGFLWTTCIFEEFIFRGLLQPWLTKWTSSSIAGIVIMSVLFGSVHLGFHGAFPNWRWLILAGVLGIFLGFARRQTRGIQAGMVAHALLVALWKMYFV